MTTPAKIDEFFGCDPFKGNGDGGPEQIDDGYYRLALREISDLFQEASYSDPTVMETKVRFIFEITGEPGFQGESIESPFNEATVSWKIKADSNGPKSTKYKIWSALLGEDYGTYATRTGKLVTPSQLIHVECWGRVENSKPKKEGQKPWPNIKEVFAELPSIAIPKMPGQARTANTIQKPAVKRPF